MMHLQKNQSGRKSIPEDELVRRAQQGDLPAFNGLVRLYDRQILELAYSLLAHLADAQDVCQETFLKAFEKIGSYRADGTFGGWLARIAVNQSINRLRQRRLRRWLSLDREPTSAGNRHAALPLEASVAGPEQELMAKELRSHVRRALTSLPNRQRVTFTLKYFHGYKIREIAEVIGCAEGTVKNALFRATQKIQKTLRFLYDEPKREK